jgi:hypothetical protein
MTSPYAGIFDTVTDSGSNLPVQDFSIFADADPFVEHGRNLSFGPWDAVFGRLSARERAIFEPQIMELMRRGEYLRETLPMAAAAGSSWARQKLKPGHEYDRASESTAEWIVRQAQSMRRYNEMLEKGLSPSEAARHVAAHMGRDPSDPSAVASVGMDTARAHAYELYGSDDPRLLETAKDAISAIRFLGTDYLSQFSPHAQQALREKYIKNLRRAEMVLGQEPLKAFAERMGIDYATLQNRLAQNQSATTSRPSAPQVATATSSETTSPLNQYPYNSPVAREKNYYQRNDPLMARSTGIYPGPSRASKYL